MGDNIKFFNIYLLIFCYDFNNLSEQYQMRKQSFLKIDIIKNLYINLRYRNFRYNADICAQIFTRYIHVRFVWETIAPFLHCIGESSCICRSVSHEHPYPCVYKGHGRKQEAMPRELIWIPIPITSPRLLCDTTMYRGIGRHIYNCAFINNTHGVAKACKHTCCEARKL